jgi:mono/diheme cytochrome c family protein
MKTRTLTLAASAMLALGTMGAVASAQSTPDAANPAAAGPVVVNTGDADGAFVASGRFNEPDGEKLYRRVCAACHMPDAEGAVGAGSYPALANNPKMAAGAYPAYVVLKGLNGMPPLGSMMTDKQVADVVNYVRTHLGNDYPEPISEAEVKAMRRD